MPVFTSCFCNALSTGQKCSFCLKPTVQEHYEEALREIPKNPAAPRMLIMGRILAERERQIQKFGIQHLKDTLESTYFWQNEKEFYQNHNDAITKDPTFGEHTWEMILMEELAEALSEKDLENKERELIQCAAVIVNWLEDIESRKAGAK